MDLAFPPIQMYPQKSSPTDKGKFSCITEPLDRLGIRFEELWEACVTLLTNPFPESDRWLISSHTVEPEGDDVYVVRVVLDGGLLKAIGKNPYRDNRDHLMYHQRVRFNKADRRITMWEMQDVWHLPALSKKEGPWSPEDLEDSFWAWRHDGRQAAAYVTFHSDGRVGWNKHDDRQGSWELEDGKTVYVTVQSEDHVFEVAEDGRRMTIVEPAGKKTLLTRMEGMYYKCVKNFQFLEGPQRIESWQEERTGVRSASADVAVACQVGFARPVVNTVMSTWGWDEFVRPGREARAAMEALSFAGGRWCWLRDEGSEELLQAALSTCDRSSCRSRLARHLGLRRLAGAMNAELTAVWSKSSQWHFRMKAGKAFCMTATTSFWCDLESDVVASRPLGTYYQEIWPWMLHEGGWLPDTRFFALDGQVYKGPVKFAWEGGVLVTEMRADTPAGRQVHQVMQKELVGAELHMTLEDKVTGGKVTRVFQRFPGYVVDNDTGEPVELTTYGPRDFVYLWPSMRRHLAKGRNWVWASGEDVDEEQAVFRLPGSKKVYEGVTLVSRRDAMPGGRRLAFLQLKREFFV